MLITYLWQRYQQFRKISKQIDQLPGPKVSSKLLGNLSLVWQVRSNTNYLQRELEMAMIGE